VDQAYELTLESAKGRPPKPEQHPGAPPSEPAPDPLEVFHVNPVVVALTKLGSSGKAAYERDLLFAPGARDEYTAVQLYRVSGDNDPNPLRLTMLRVRANKLVDAHWVVERYDRDNKTPTSQGGE